MTPNWFTALALLSWPLVALWFYLRTPGQSGNFVDDYGRANATAGGRVDQV